MGCLTESDLEIMAGGCKFLAIGKKEGLLWHTSRSRNCKRRRTLRLRTAEVDSALSHLIPTASLREAFSVSG